MARLDAETDNFRAAMDWALREGHPALAVRLAGRLGRYWELRGAAVEGGRWLEAAIEAADEEVPLEDLARALRAEVVMLEDQGSWYDVGGSRATSRNIALEAVAMSRRAGDPAGIADALLRLSAFEQDKPEPHSGTGRGGAHVCSRGRRRCAHRRGPRKASALVSDRRRRCRDRGGRCPASEVGGHPRTCRDLQRRGLPGHHAGQLRTRGPHTSTKRSRSRRGRVSRSGSSWPSATWDSLRYSWAISKLPARASRRSFGSPRARPALARIGGHGRPGGDCGLPG